MNYELVSDTNHSETDLYRVLSLYCLSKMYKNTQHFEPLPIIDLSSRF